MPSWNSAQYLRFAEERTRPARDLAAAIAIAQPARVLDLGCGPANSTAVLARRWPSATFVGVDSSADMLAAARRELPGAVWIHADIATWRPETSERFDVVFANASLQWVPDHGHLCPRLLSYVAAGGAFAMQVPANQDAAPHRAMRELAASDPWRALFSAPPRPWHWHPPEFYYDVLAPHASRIDIWCTEYVHVLGSVDEIVEWYRGTGLRPWLDALSDDERRREFERDYRARLVPGFPPRPDGRVLFPFRRLFVIAYR